MWAEQIGSADWMPNSLSISFLSCVGKGDVSHVKLNRLLFVGFNEFFDIDRSGHQRVDAGSVPSSETSTGNHPRFTVWIFIYKFRCIFQGGIDFDNFSIRLECRYRKRLLRIQRCRRTFSCALTLSAFAWQVQREQRLPIFPAHIR
jgi:hypothetical protein